MRRIRERVRGSLFGRDDGFGLTEVAVAIIVLGIVLVGLFPLTVDSIRLAAKNAEQAQANRIVSAQLDRLRTELREEHCGPAPVNTEFVEFEVSGFMVTTDVGPCPEPQRLADVMLTVTKADSGGGTVHSGAQTRMIVRPVVVSE